MNAELSRIATLVRESAQRLRLDVTLIGALAAELIAEREAGRQSYRATNDADFAVQVGSWNEFDRLKSILVAAGCETDPHREHRLVIGSAWIDLVPFGSVIEIRDGILRWPVTGAEMIVTGLQEACSVALLEKLANGESLRCLTPAGYALLKIVAYLDRSARGAIESRNDAQDLLFWLRNFANGACDDRRFDVAEKFGADIPFDEAGAVLLGFDVGGLSSPGADRHVRRFLDSVNGPYAAFANAAANRWWDEDTDEKDRAEIVRLVVAFGLGYRAARDGLPAKFR